MTDNNEQQRAIRDYTQPMVNGNYSNIAHQTIAANNFELNALISMVQQNQFGVSPFEDLNVHLTALLEICDTVKMNNV